MRKYDKILVPCDKQEATSFDSWGEGPGYYHPKENVIVLSIEELRHLWNAGGERGYDDAMEVNGLEAPPEEKAPDFKTYLKSKGIDIP